MIVYLGGDASPRRLTEALRHTKQFKEKKMFTHLYTSALYRKMYKAYTSPLWWMGSYINVLSAANKEINK